MASISTALGTLLSELQRRKVTQIILGYGAFAWLLLQFGALLFETFDSPAWAMRLLFLVLLLGLPVTVVLAWVFEFSPRGIERTASLEQLSAPHRTGLPVILAARISDAESEDDISDGQANLLLREAALSSREFHSAASRVDGCELLLAFEEADSALLFALRFQAHARQLGVGLRVALSPVDGPAGPQSLDSGQAAAVQGLLDSTPAGSVVAHSAVRNALQASRDTVLADVLTALPSGHHHVIPAAQVAKLDAALQGRAGHTRAGEPSTALKVLALAFLTVTVGLIWSWLPSIQRSAQAPIPTLAVLPFVDPTHDEGLALLVDGLSEDLFNAVGRIQGIRITARRSSRQMRDSGLGVSEIGQRLGAGLLLEGEIRPVDGRLRVTAWLTETSSGLERWNRSFEEPTVRLGLMRTQLANALAEELGLPSPAESPELPSAVTASHAQLYPLYLEALGYLNLPRSADTLGRAEQLFNDIIASAPDYAAARAGLCRTLLAWYMHGKDLQHFQRAEAACQATLEAEQENVDVLLALAELHRVRGQHQQALDYYRRGLALNAGSVELQAGMGRLLQAMDRKDEAEQALRAALVADPAYSPLYNDLGHLYWDMGRWEAAVEMFTQAARLEPDNYGVLANLGSAYYYSGRNEEALEAYERSLQLEPNRTALNNSATIRYAMGEYQAAADLYLRATRIEPADFRLWSNLADTESLIPGREAEARAHYQRAYDLLQGNLAVNQKDAQTLALLAWCAANIEQPGEAELRITDAILQDGDNPVILYYAAQVHRRIGHPELARNFVQRALEQGFPADVMAATPGLGELMP